jgi:hypothetical protein
MYESFDLTKKNDFSRYNSWNKIKKINSFNNPLNLQRLFEKYQQLHTTEFLTYAFSTDYHPCECCGSNNHIGRSNSDGLCWNCNRRLNNRFQKNPLKYYSSLKDIFKNSVSIMLELQPLSFKNYCILKIYQLEFFFLNSNISTKLRFKKIRILPKICR